MVYKEHEIKTNLVQEHWLCSYKWSFYWVITWKLLFRGEGRINLWWGDKNLVGESVLEKDFSSGGGGGGGIWANFWLVEGTENPERSTKNAHSKTFGTRYIIMKLIIFWSFGKILSLKKVTDISPSNENFPKGRKLNEHLGAHSDNYSKCKRKT